METTLIGKYVKNIKSGKLYGKIIREDSNKVYTNLNEGFAYKKRIGATWEPVNNSGNNSGNNLGNNLGNNSAWNTEYFKNNSRNNSGNNSENNSVNNKNINGINPANINKNNSSELKIYKLTKRSGSAFTCYDTFVISAYSELQARRIAQFNGAQETVKGSKRVGNNTYIEKFPYWTDNKFTSCKLLVPKNLDIGIICSSYSE